MKRNYIISTFIMMSVFMAEFSVAEDLRYPDVYAMVVERKIDMAFTEIRSVLATRFHTITGADQKLTLDEYLKLGDQTRSAISLQPSGMHGVELDQKTVETAKQKANQIARDADSKYFRSADSDANGTLSANEYVEKYLTYLRTDDSNANEILEVSEAAAKLKVVGRAMDKAHEVLEHIKRLDTTKADRATKEFDELSKELKP